MSNSIFCSPTHLKLIVGDADSKNIKISDFDEIALPGGSMINGIITDEEIMTKFLLEVNSRYALAKGDTYLVLDSSNIQSKSMNVPPLSDARVLEFIKREYSQYDEAETDNVYDFTVLNPKSQAGGVTILAVAVGSPLLQSYRTVLAGAGFNLKGINIGLNCQIKLAGFLPQLQSGTIILAQIDGRQLSLTIFDGGKYLFANKYRMVQQEGSPEWVAEIGNNLSSMIQFNKSQRTGSEISAAYFAGLPEDNLAALTESLTYHGIEINMLDLSGRITLNGPAKTKGGFDAGRYLLNIGNLLKK